MARLAGQDAVATEAGEATVGYQIQRMDRGLDQATNAIEGLYGRIRSVVDMGTESPAKDPGGPAVRQACELVEMLRTANSRIDELTRKISVLANAVQL
jgi:hypothetical protein